MATVSGTSSDLGTIELEDGLLGSKEIPHRCLVGMILANKQLNKQAVSNILHCSAVSNILHCSWKVRNSCTISSWNDNFSFQLRK
ncbi:hypothetical protein HYC85_025242 [Camellia sinensis]|uniref:Uncharacterized protein n=1 Tax=Camellia sinensis TaxID=4442 RepID=A0A7J7GEG9_CAMSI|nr:hypothetical protein HYC85_025242 [Camellia sinensis]